MQLKNGSLLLFRLLGVNVYVHWSWALIAIYQVWRNQNQAALGGRPHSMAYFIGLYLCLFLIVLIHEFGHALACKSVGGQADQIILWPLGGVAYVQPPQRAGAMLWSIAAGPLVNVVLIPLTLGPVLLLAAYHITSPAVDFLQELAIINLVLLIFNMLPIYPLDGGQILRSLLWFICGRAWSLLIAAGIGLAGAGGLILAAIYLGSTWLAVMVLFMGSRSLTALRIGKAMLAMERSQRHTGEYCPQCGENPPVGNFWTCPCGTRFDTFTTGGRCPACGRTFENTACPLCGQVSPLQQWYATGGFPVQPAPAQG